ncbi:uncharacterized protein K452DRAFT_312854 [Aplosporella prunicola CBS 121167]|uniref:Fungal N-terminal domain-containing protein n=1 Tax=Aplosporella prunicola CBS 121167 TaxID=1176127 RepID=A0A6A6B0R1_9PEZI|nr:uncharacterized protein K452DRAFT_312854 [Aplosporella prunicola CBS 121167]KAF2136835.1 hypothetical protein K452DRAFT_312854 [Aplosporella prunicola CBS 121167]
MSGVEAIGVIASASQISSYILNIILQINTIRTELRDAPDRIKQQDKDLSILLSTIKTIQSVELPREEEFQDYILSVQKNVTDLRRTLEKNHDRLEKTSLVRFWTAIKAIKAEDQILKKFGSLEIAKSNLSLYLQTKMSSKNHSETKRISSSEYTSQESPSQALIEKAGESLVPHNSRETNLVQGTQDSRQNGSASKASPVSNPTGSGISNTFNGCGIKGNRNRSELGNVRSSQSVSNSYTDAPVEGDDNRLIHGNIDNKVS